MKTLMWLIALFSVSALLRSVSLAQGPSVHGLLPPGAQETLDKGVIAAKQQDYPLAIRFFQEARKAAPNAPEIFFNLGLAESKIPGRELRSICWFGAYLAANPNAPNASAVKGQIDALDVKSQSNLYSLARLLPGMQEMAELIQDAYWKSNGLSTLANFQVVVGDIGGAKKTLASALKTGNQIRDAGRKNLALDLIAEVQASAGDIAGAQKTAAQIQDASYKCSVLSVIAENQARAGDIAGAKKTLAFALATVDLIQKPDSRSPEQALIAEAQVTAGDIAGAQRTADSIQDAHCKSEAQKAIAEARHPIAEAQAKASSTWLRKLDDTDASHECPLNTDLFLNLSTYLKSLPPPSNDQNQFNCPLCYTALKIAKAQNIIDQMLKQQASN